MPSKQPRKGRKPYTYDHYEAEIRKLFPEVQLLKAFVEANPEDLETAKELEKKKGTLRWYRDCWAKRIPVTVYVDGREQLPNSAEELGYPTEQTPQYNEKKWPYYSVGDYIAYVLGIGWYPVCRERKSLNDLYDTLIDEDHRGNLYDEFARFLTDKRFTIFRFDLECTEEEFFNYFPPKPNTCKFCQHRLIKMDSGDYFCSNTAQIYPSKDITPGFRCHDGFVPRKRGSLELRGLWTLKETILRQCRELGMQIVWRGSREEACKKYRPGVEEWLKLNYVKLLKLEDPVYNDRVLLENRIAQLEAELQAARASLERLDMQTAGELAQGVEV